jgi:hypothetical protein
MMSKGVNGGFCVWRRYFDSMDSVAWKNATLLHWQYVALALDHAIRVRWAQVRRH